VEEIIMMVTGIMIVTIIWGSTITLKYLCTQFSIKKLGILYSIGFILIFISYGCLIVSHHYSVDAFNLLFDPSPYWHLQIGRYLNCGIILIANRLGIHQVTAQRIACFCWLFAVSFVILLISVMFIKYAKIKDNIHSYVVVLAVALAFINVFTMELYLFTEMFLVGIWGIIALGLAIIITAMNFSNRKRWIISFLYLLIALGNYQGYIGIYIVFVFTLIFFKYKHDMSRCVHELLSAISCAGLASISNIAILKILIQLNLTADVGRGTSFSLSVIKMNIFNLIKYQTKFWFNADNLMAIVIMLLLLCFLIVLIIWMMRDFNRKEKMTYMGIILVSYIICFAAHFIESNQVLSPRSNIAIWSWIAGILLLALCHASKYFIRKIFISTTTVLIILLGINYIHMQDMAANTCAVNAADFVEAMKITEHIKNYEYESGINIQKIAVGYDKSVTFYQPFSRYKNYELGKRILATDYSGYRLIGYMLDRNLEKCELPIVICDKFKEQDWDTLNVKEQILFAGDTVYLAIY